jgi:membrane-associated phospholipid phosphatase
MKFKDRKGKIRIRETLLYRMICPILACASVLAPAFRADDCCRAASLQSNLQRAAQEISDRTDAKAAIGVSAALMLLGRSEEFKAGQMLLISIAGSSAVTAGLKYVVNRKRPIPPTVRKNASFPSGHATASFAAATVTAYAYPRLAIPAYLAAGTISYSRLYLRRHYPTDIVAGALIGITVSRFVIRHRDPLTMEGHGLIGAFIEADAAGLIVHF